MGLAEGRASASCPCRRAAETALAEKGMSLLETAVDQDAWYVPWE